MKKGWIVALIVLIIVVVGGWYLYSHNSGQSEYGTSGSASEQSAYTENASTTTTTTTSTAPSTAEAAVLQTGTSATLGTYLMASNGMTLYVFNQDTANKSNCTGQCATIWPPYAVPTLASLPPVSADIAGKIATITRADGSMQVTYNGKPVYFYEKDTQPGDTMGQGVGGVWFVAKP